MHAKAQTHQVICYFELLKCASHYWAKNYNVNNEGNQIVNVLYLGTTTTIIVAFKQSFCEEKLNVIVIFCKLFIRHYEGA